MTTMVDITAYTRAAHLSLALPAVLLDPLRDECGPWIHFSRRPLRAGGWLLVVSRDPPLGTVWRPQPAGPPGSAGQPIRTLHLDASRRTLHLTVQTGPWAVRFALRLIRAVLRRQLHRTGEVFLHAAALARGSRTLLIAGPSRSGKTSLLLALLDRPEPWRFLGNDDVSVAVAAGQLLAYGWPRGIEIRSDTLPRLGGLGARLSGLARADVLHLRPRQLACISRTPLAAEGRLCLLIRPTWAESSSAPDPLSHLLQPADPVETWLEPYLPAPIRHSAEALGALARLPLVTPRFTLPTLSRTAAELAAHLEESHP